MTSAATALGEVSPDLAAPFDEVTRCLLEAAERAGVAAERARAGLAPGQQAQEALAAVRAAMVAARFAVWCGHDQEVQLRP